MRRFGFIFIFLLYFLSTHISFAETFVDDDIVEDTTWTTSGSPYIITFPISVTETANLFIESGVVVKFDIVGGLNINGGIVVDGTNSEPVYFTSLCDDSVGGDTNNDMQECAPTENDWGSVYIQSQSNQVVFRNMIERYSSGGLVIDGGQVLFSHFDSDQRILLFGVGGDLNFVTIPELKLFGVDNITLNHLLVEGEQSPILGIYDNSNVKIIGSNVNGGSNFSDSVAVFGNSFLNISDTKIDNYNTTGGSLGVYDSRIVVDNINIVNSHNGILLYGGSNSSIKDSSVSCGHDGISGFNTSVNILNTSIQCGHDGVVASVSSFDIDGTSISGASDAGVVSYDGSNNLQEISIKNSEIYNNNTGIAGYQSPIVATGNSIHGNTIGAFNFDDLLGDINMRGNWWGDASGPFHETLNVEGKGDQATDNISYYPWLHYDPLHPGLSSVLFIPGFQASRMYKTKNIPLIGQLEDKLWEPNTNADVVDMSMDVNGVSLNPNIYTRDIIDIENVLGFGGDDIYKSFIEDMNGLVTEGKMNDWRAIPYDWRLSPDDVINRGTENSEGNILYNEELEQGQTPFILKELQTLADTSSDGKVTIVTHSNGGLIAKALIKKLKYMKSLGQNNLLDSIDRLIMVAAPQIGTPKAVASLLHGYNQGVRSGLFLKQNIARNFGQNLPGAYALLPSQQYITTAKEPVIIFDKSIDVIKNFREVYSNSIDTFAKFYDFILGVKDKRVNPKSIELEKPTVLNSFIYNNTESFHNSIDELVIPDNIKIYQVAGWGLPTIKNITYFSEKECIYVLAGKPCTKINVLSEKFMPTVDGDKTVVSPSAVYLNNKNTKNYFLNLSLYNQLINNNHTDHATIFEVPYLRNLIKNILKDITTIPDYITSEKPKASDNLIVISVPKKVSSLSVLSVKDNKKTGPVVKDKNQNNPSNPSSGSDFNNVTQDIPGSSYVDLGGRSYIVLPAGNRYIVNVTSSTENNVPTENNPDVPDSNNGGEIVIRQDVVSGETVTDTTFFPNVPVNSGTNNEFTVEPGGGTSDLNVDNNGDGNIDNYIPPIVVHNPNPVDTPAGPIDIPEELLPQPTPVIDNNNPIIIKVNNAHPIVGITNVMENINKNNTTVLTSNTNEERIIDTNINTTKQNNIINKVLDNKISNKTDTKIPHKEVLVKKGNSNEPNFIQVASAGEPDFIIDWKVFLFVVFILGFIYTILRYFFKVK